MTAKEIESQLLGKFKFSRNESHHKMFELNIEGIPAIKTKFSYGHQSSQLSKKLESKIAKQLRVRTGYFREIIGCTKNRDDYVAKVRVDPFPPFEHSP